MPMYLVAFTIPLTMCRRPTPLAEMQPQTIIFRRCFTVRFRNSGLNTSPGNILTYVFPNRQKVLSTLIRTFSHIPQLQLAHCRAHRILLRLWPLVISGFLQPIRPNCRHRQRSVDKLPTTVHFSHHSHNSWGDVNLTMRHVIAPSWSPNGNPRRTSGHWTGLPNPRI